MLYYYFAISIHNIIDNYISVGIWVWPPSQLSREFNQVKFDTLVTSLSLTGFWKINSSEYRWFSSNQYDLSIFSTFSRYFYLGLNKLIVLFFLFKKKLTVILLIMIRYIPVVLLIPTSCGMITISLLSQTTANCLRQ